MKKTLFNDGFQCKILDYNADLLHINEGISEIGYEPVDIPHDALIDDANSFYTDKVIWYRRRLGTLPASDKRLILYFEGVYMDASIYINEQFVGKWVNGYTSFWFDITDYVNSPDDYLYVSIDYRCPNSRWYGGPGINRNVWLYEASNDHFLIDSLYICPHPDSNGSWTINASVELDFVMSTSSKYEITLNCNELSLHNTMYFDSTSNSPRFTISDTVSNPSLWDTDSPVLYPCYAQLSVDGVITDTIDTVFGFRDIKMSADEGFFLNGRKLKLNGVCLHSDQGCLGTAFYEEMALRQLKLMKDMGVNAIRLTHNVQAPGFLDLCDRLGLLVLDEAFDCWKLPKTKYDYARFFEEWSQKDIRSWIMRDRNHPCVFLWSAGNEIYDTHAGEDGAKTLLYITEQIKTHDFFGHAPVALCSNYMAWDNTIKAIDFLNFAGYNYGEYLYEQHHKAHPDWVIFGSETASVVQSRGIYHFPLCKSLLVDDDEHCSSLGNCCTSWGAESMDFCVTTERDNTYSLGQFLWAGIDYLGEPTPYHTKNSYFGLADTACFPKDVYYMLKSCWRSADEAPMIHILPYWDFNEGQTIDVRVCSNYETVELFFNDTSLGRKTIDHKKGMSMYADYQLPYHKGTLKAVGYDENGTAVVTAIAESFEDTAALSLSLPEFSVSDGDRDLRFVEIQAVDTNGRVVENASDRVNISVEGPAKLFGIVNGNQTDMESFKGSSMRLFSGKLLAVIKPDCDAGLIKINASLDSVKYVRKLNIQTSASNKCSEEKIVLTPDSDTLIASIQVLPIGATYKAIEYQITNDSGVPIDNAQIESISEDGLTVTIRAIADADFNLRAMCREDDDRITVISVMEFSATGFGELYKNPYKFISASLYDDCRGELGNGNEKGIATSRTEDTYILYRNLNFGAVGTKHVNIPIFELGGEAVDITFWKGMPHASGSQKIGHGIYHKPSIWNVYQPEIFELDTVLTDIDDFALEVKGQKIHIKGFTFLPLDTTFDKHELKNAAHIYGDQYTITDELIKGIGNNVCITYEDMNFGKNGTDRITISGYTPLFQNTIHIRFNNGTSEQRQIIEFPHTDCLTAISFDLNPICGKGNLSFIFLPGSDFDFKSFIFTKKAED